MRYMRMQYKKMLSPYKKSIFIYIILSFFKSGLALLPPYVYLLFIEEITKGQKIEMIVFLLWSYVFIFIAQSLAILFYKKVYNSIFPSMIIDTKMSVMKYYLNCRMLYLRKYKHGDIKERINDDAENMVLHIVKVIDILVNFINLFVIACVLLSLNCILAGFSFLMIPISFYFTRFMQKKGNKEYGEQRELQTSYNDFMLDVTSHWKELRSNAIESIQEKQFHFHMDRLGRVFLKAHMCWFINRTFIAFKDEFMIRISLYLLGGYLVINGFSQISILLSFVEYYGNFVKILLDTTDILIKKGKEFVASKRVVELLDIGELPNLVMIDEVNEISFENINFSYTEGKRKIFEDFNFVIRKGTHLEIIGESGSGKSTFLKLLLGIEEAESGVIKVNGINIKNISFQSLAEKIGIIEQESYLFNLSIRENLFYAKENATEEEIRNACEKARIFEYIESLPEGLDTLIGENGVKLSGGQRQRLILARLFLKKPDIIIMDEATSALDSENERFILDEIYALTIDKMFIVITHRNMELKMINKKLILGNY